MDPALADALLFCASVYLCIGLVFAPVFLTVGLKHFDHNAAEAAPIQFRLIIAPGVIALWPLLLLLALKRLAAGQPA